MLRLLLLRHSKAVPYAGKGDHERPLTERGRSDASRMGSYIADQKCAPDAAIHSGAQRTRETLAIVLTRLRPGIDVYAETGLYEGASAAFLSAVRGVRDEAATALIVGHNPTIAEMASRLARAGEADALARMTVKFPTSALAILDFEAAQWRDVTERAGRLVDFVTPRSLGGEGD
jgi:phosphohistidine phosphatase